MLEMVEPAEPAAQEEMGELQEILAMLAIMDLEEMQAIQEILDTMDLVVPLEMQEILEIVGMQVTTAVMQVAAAEEEVVAKIIQAQQGLGLQDLTGNLELQLHRQEILEMAVLVEVMVLVDIYGLEHMDHQGL